jgi:hypothetical protein
MDEEESTPVLTVVPVGQLTADDVGSRIVLLEGDTPFDGMLTRIFSMYSSYRKAASTHLEITKPSKVELKLPDVPHDYLVQIER